MSRARSFLSSLLAAAVFTASFAPGVLAQADAAPTLDQLLEKVKAGWRAEAEANRKLRVGEHVHECERREYDPRNDRSEKTLGRGSLVIAWTLEDVERLSR